MRLLEFSIKEKTSLAVEVSAIYSFQRQIPTPKRVENRPRTPFSFQRFLIPELCGHRGKAIYLDADMQVFADIAELWNIDFGGCDLQTVGEGKSGRRGQFSVMLLDCEQLDWNVERIVADLDSNTLDYSSLMYEMRIAKRIGHSIPENWNTLEAFDPVTTRLLHYTDMNTQPWISTANPLGHIWINCLMRAIEQGFITHSDVEREIERGHVRPTLKYQTDTGEHNPLRLSSAVRKLDRDFVPPYSKLQAGKARPWTSTRSAARALFRRLYYQSPLARHIK